MVFFPFSWPSPGDIPGSTGAQWHCLVDLLRLRTLDRGTFAFGQALSENHDLVLLEGYGWPCWDVVSTCFNHVTSLIQAVICLNVNQQI